VQPRTRAVLAALNIPVWMGRGAAVQRARVSVWRDDAPSTDQKLLAESVEVSRIEAQPVHAKSDRAVLAERVEVQPFADAQPVKTEPRQALQPMAPPSQLTKPVIAKPAAAILTEPQTAIKPLIRFSVQARLIGDWIVLVPEQALQDEACQRLWGNIVQATTLQATSTAPAETFVWPLAEGARWQRMEGASAALAGFLYRLGKTQRVGLMGELPDQVCPDRIERLPSLPELLANPLQKRSLWLLLRG